jgi:tRNA G18 (ribose-2'-O)-methylase SpoU
VRKLTHDEISGRRVPKEEALHSQRTPVIGLLDNIRSLYNVGSIFRTADGAALQSLYLCGYTPVPPRKEIDKTALGSTETVPWQRFPSALEGARHAKSLGAKIVVLEHTTEARPYFEADSASFPVCLVLGNELVGVSPEVITIADAALEIPMYGFKQSLNAAVAFGIAVFELTRLWRQSL